MRESIRQRLLNSQDEDRAILAARELKGNYALEYLFDYLEIEATAMIAQPMYVEGVDINKIRLTIGLLGDIRNGILTLAEAQTTEERNRDE